MNELDELKAKWLEHDRELEQQVHLNLQFLTVAIMSNARPPLRRLMAFLTLELIITFAAMIALGGFIYAHIFELRFSVPALALDLFALALVVSYIRQLACIQQIDYGKPITVIQKQLEVLRKSRLRQIQWILLLAVLAWTLFVIVAFKAFLGMDIYSVTGVTNVLANLLSGLAVIPLALWLSRKFGSRLWRYNLMQRLVRSLGGYNLNAADEFLATLAEFESEKPTG